MPKVKKKKARREKKERTRLNAGQKETLKEFKGAETIAKRLKLLKPLERIDLKELEALVDPNNAAFQGDLSPEEQAVIARTQENYSSSQQLTSEEKRNKELLENAFANSGIRSQEVSAILDGLKSTMDSAGVRSQDMNETIERLKANISNIDKEDSRLTEAFAKMKDGLAGFNSAEMQAIRDKSTREIAGRKAQAERNLNNALARNKVQGAAAAVAQGQLERSALKDERAAESDLLVKNAELIDGRLNAYTGALSDLEKSNDSNKTAAIAALADTVRGSDADLMSSKLQAAGLYSKAVLEQAALEDQEKDEALANLVAGNTQISSAADARKHSALSLLNDTTLSASNAKDGRLIQYLKMLQEGRAENAGISASEQAARVAGITGVLNYDVAKENAKAQLEAIRGSGRGGGSGSSSPDTSSMDAALQAVLDQLKEEEE